MDLEPSDFRDPSTLIAEVAQRVDLRPGDVYLVLVRDPSTRQRVEDVVLLALDAEQDDWQHARDELVRVMSTLRIPREWPRRCAVVTVVVRNGRTVLSAAELLWLTAWRYSNHLRDCYDSDLVLVTEHGWYDLATGWGDSLPAAV